MTPDDLIVTNPRPQHAPRPSNHIAATSLPLVTMASRVTEKAKQPAPRIVSLSAPNLALPKLKWLSRNSNRLLQADFRALNNHNPKSLSPE